MDYGVDSFEFTLTPADAGAPFCFTVPIVDDNLVEYTENFSLVLRGSSGVSVKDGQHVVNIIDNDGTCICANNRFFEDSCYHQRCRKQIYSDVASYIAS